jgi:hypothetical protein
MTDQQLETLTTCLYKCTKRFVKFGMLCLFFWIAYHDSPLSKFIGVMGITYSVLDYLQKD